MLVASLTAIGRKDLPFTVTITLRRRRAVHRGMQAAHHPDTV